MGWAQNGSFLYNTNGGNVGVGTSTPGQALDVVGSVRATGDVLPYGFPSTLSINIRAVVNKASANALCSSGTAIYTPSSWRGKTGAQICAGDTRGKTTCTGVKFMYVTEANGFGAYAPNDMSCGSAVNYPWPWGADYSSPDTLDGEWGHGDTWIVCCN